jgi:hypothetical protein
MRTKIILTPSDKVLVGKYSNEHDHVHVILDSTNGAFSVTLPDCRSNIHTEIIFKNIGVNDVTIVPVNGQYIDNKLSHTIKQWDLVTVWPDLLNTWYLLDSNVVPDSSVGWLHNNGSGVLAWTTPTCSDIGALPVGNVSGTAGYIPKFATTSSIVDSGLYTDGNNFWVNQNWNNGVSVECTVQASVNEGQAQIGVINGSRLLQALQYGPSHTGAACGVNKDGLARITSDAGSGLLIDHQDNAPIIFGINNVEKARITSTGIGIGASSVNALLHLKGDLATASTFANADYGQLHVEQSLSNASKYVKITFGSQYSYAGLPEAAIGVREETNGSYMVFGTSNTYASGITNNALIIDPAGSITFSNQATGLLTSNSGALTSNSVAAGYIPYMSSTSAAANSPFYVSSGMVGIGVTPARALDLGSTGNSITFGDNAGTGTAGRGIFWHSGSGYGIFRGTGAWPQNLNIVWGTGISLDSGSTGLLLNPTGYKVQICGYGHLNGQARYQGGISISNINDVKIADFASSATADLTLGSFFRPGGAVGYGEFLFFVNGPASAGTGLNSASRVFFVSRSDFTNGLCFETEAGPIILSANNPTSSTSYTDLQINTNHTITFGSQATGLLTSNSGLITSNTITAGYMPYATAANGASMGNSPFYTDGNNVGLGITPSAWQTTSGSKALQFLGSALYGYQATNLNIVQNAYMDGAWKYYASSIASSLITMASGAIYFYTIAAGTANNTISWSEKFKIANNGEIFAHLPTSAGTTGSLWCDTTGGLNIVKVA